MGVELFSLMVLSWRRARGGSNLVLPDWGVIGVSLGVALVYDMCRLLRLYECGRLQGLSLGCADCINISRGGEIVRIIT